MINTRNFFGFIKKKYAKNYPDETAVIFEALIKKEEWFQGHITAIMFKFVLMQTGHMCS